MTTTMMIMMMMTLMMMMKFGDDDYDDDDDDKENVSKSTSLKRMDVGTGGTRGRCPHVSKNQEKCPCVCNLEALLENFANANMNRKYVFPAISEDLSFIISRGSMPPDPPSCFALFHPPD